MRSIERFADRGKVCRCHGVYVVDYPVTIWGVLKMGVQMAVFTRELNEFASGCRFDDAALGGSAICRRRRAHGSDYRC